MTTKEYIEANAIRVILQDMPCTVRACVLYDDTGVPLILVNARLTRQQQLAGLIHEVRHIRRGDMDNIKFR